MHEFGHQFFYGLLASNEFEEAWLDEGFNTYMTDRVLKAVYGPNHVDPVGLRPPLPARHRHPTTRSTTTGATSRCADWDVARARRAGSSATARSYGATSTRRRPWPWRRSSGSSARPAMDRALRLYADRWRFRHPKTGDFIAAVNEVDGPGLEVVLRPDVLLLRDRRLRRRRGESQPAARPRAASSRRTASSRREPAAGAREAARATTAS